jgi:DNA repair protein RecO (recombination protein O)
MAARSCKAIVLKTMEFKDSSAIATLLTPEFGRVDCIAKGCRRPKNKFAAGVQTLNLIEVVYQHKNGRSLQTLVEAHLLREHRVLKNDIELFAHASYIAQLVGSFVQEAEPADDMFALLGRALEEIDGSHGNIKLLTAALTLRAVSTAGFGLHLTTCVRCGKGLDKKIRLDFVAGGAICGGCRGDGPAITREDTVLVHRLGRTSAEDVRSMVVPSERAERLMALVYRYATVVLEKDLTAWRFIESLAVAERRLQSGTATAKT